MPLKKMKQLRRAKNAIKKGLERLYERSLINTKFIILSDNCWGYEVYKAVNREYNTPLIGLFMYPDCFTRFIADIRYYIDAPMKITNESKYLLEKPTYPVGVIGDGVEIHFMHYKDEKECISKWNRRKERLRHDLFVSKIPVFVKMCDRSGGCDNSHWQRFYAASSYNLISFGTNDLHLNSHLRIHRKDAVLWSEGHTTAPDGLALYMRRYSYFDIVYWIKFGIIKKTIVSRLLGFLS